jgi:hypothetical protein
MFMQQVPKKPPAQSSSQYPPLIEEIAIFASTCNISTRSITSNNFRKVIKAAIKLGQEHPTDSLTDLVPPSSRKYFQKCFCDISQFTYDSFLEKYSKTPVSTLCTDGGKHKTRPNLIVVLSNTMESIPPLIIETARFFKGHEGDYKNTISSIL